MFTSVNAKVFEYDKQLIIGQDEYLDTLPFSFGLEPFTRILGWNTAQIEEFRQAAIAWFIERYGIDFTNAPFDPLKGGWYNGFATLLPISFEGKYRVQESTSKTFGPVDSELTQIQLSEFIVTFDPNAVFEYGGTYGGVDGVKGMPSSALSFGCYLVNGEYHFLMKAAVPVEVDARGQAREVVLLYSPTFGPGLSVINIGITFTPNSDGKFPTYVHGIWSFPGSQVIPEYNSYTASPVSFPITP